MVFWTIVFLAPWLIKNRLSALKFLLITGLPMAGYLIFRLVYFHDILPNTYYLKLYKIPLDWRLLRGWYHFSRWAEPLWLVWALLPIMMIPLRRQKAMWLSLVLIINYLAYNVYVGGDAWEDWDIGANRFTIITIPWALIILVAGGSAWASKIKGNAARLVNIALPSLACLLVFALVNGIMFVPDKMKHLERLMVVEEPFNSEYQMWNTLRALEMNDFLGPEDRAATVQAGDIGYFANCELIDVLGYNDRQIARTGSYWHFQYNFVHWYVPGHCKVDYPRVIGELKPDYIVDKWTKFNNDVEKEFYDLLAAGNYVEYPTGGWIKADFQYPKK